MPRPVPWRVNTVFTAPNPVPLISKTPPGIRSALAMPAAAKNNPAADTAKMNLFVFIDTPTVLAAHSPLECAAARLSLQQSRVGAKTHLNIARNIFLQRIYDPDLAEFFPVGILSGTRTTI
jgi:hypothetical protein